VWSSPKRTRYCEDRTLPELIRHRSRLEAVVFCHKMLMWTQIFLLGLLALAACEETSDYSSWINNRRSLSAGKSSYSTANCNCNLGVCTSWPPMCCSNQGLCQNTNQDSQSTVSFCCDHQTDPSHCGQCNQQCSSGKCVGGTCVAQGESVSPTGRQFCGCLSSRTPELVGRVVCALPAV